MRMIAVRKDEQEEEEEVQRSYEHVYGRTILIKPNSYLPQLPKLRVTAAPSVAPSSCLQSASPDGQRWNAIACWL